MGSCRLSIVTWFVVLANLAFYSAGAPHNEQQTRILQASGLIPHHHREEHHHSVIRQELMLLQREVVAKLHHGANTSTSEQSEPFGDLMVSYPISSMLVHDSDHKGNEEKYYIGTRTIPEQKRRFVAYGFGAFDDISFEQSLAELGADVNVFDCTVKEPNSSWTVGSIAVKFYPWCLGKKQDFQGNIYTQNQTDKDFEFHSLSEIKLALNHSTISLLKMDIEGFEWDILQNDILKGPKDALPEQLLFELHTQGAKPQYVPSHLVEGKTRQVVSKFFLDLYEIGYRITNFELNTNDKYCAEFALLKIR